MAASNQLQEQYIEFELGNAAPYPNLIENEIIESLLIYLIENCWLFLLLCVQVNKNGNTRDEMNERAADGNRSTQKVVAERKNNN